MDPLMEKNLAKAQETVTVTVIFADQMRARQQTDIINFTCWMNFAKSKKSLLKWLGN